MTIDDIRTFLQTEILNDPSREIGEEEDLLLSETLDSLGVTRLVGFLERETGLEIPAQHVTLKNFASLKKIDAYLASRAG